MIALIIGIISLVIILAVIGVNIYMMIVINRNSSYIKGLKNNKDEQMNKINKINEVINNKINILDLAEFKDLDPYLKDAYKKYIVNILSSAFMKAVNKSATDNEVKKYLTDNQKEIDEMAYEIAKELQTNGFPSYEDVFSSYEDVFPPSELSDEATS